MFKICTSLSAFYKYLLALKGKLEKIICPPAIMSECIFLKDLHRSVSQLY